MTARKTGPQSGGESADQGLSLREFARRLGISEKAVRKARDAGRLANCLGNDGKVVDFERAKNAFATSSRTGVGVRTDGPQVPPQGPQQPPAPSPAATSIAPPAPREQLDADEPGEEAGGQLVFAKTLIDAQTLATNERARKLKFENDVTEGRLVPVEVVTKEAFETKRIIRENILNLPARIAGELAAEMDTGRVHRRLEAALHEALNATADALLVVNE